jgi:hypothetical protein
MALKGVPPELYKSSTGHKVNKFQSGTLHEVVATVGQMEAQKTRYESMIQEKDSELSIMDGLIDNFRSFIEQFEDILARDSKGIQEAIEDLELKNIKQNTSDKAKLGIIFSTLKDQMIEPEPAESAAVIEQSEETKA